jgi:soluble lytic murein transglycosylase-like protein
MQRSRAAGYAAVLVALVVAAGCGLTGKHDGTAAYTPAGVTASASDSPYLTDEPTPEETTSSPKPRKSPSKKPSPKATSATPTEDPNNFQLPACAHHSGTLVSKSSARAALSTAAAKMYWPSSAPTLKLSFDLVKSVSWHESGWQSNIVNCDGGRGLMQVMPDTVSMINNRFGTAYVATDYKQNAILGANYLAWLTKYFGDNYFKGKYDLSTGKCRTHASPCLLNMVIAAYNSGFGAVDASYGDDKTLPNPAYVDSVRSLMASCYCDRY